ncbi:MAG: DUF4097 family beta strand repeat-containing protein, partial [Anaerolineae bacterium]|nr:DUF4097 family beta strand repeat-containing protein [Anaerolineae bacterium]
FVDVLTESGTVRVKTAKGVKVDGKYTKVEISDISGVLLKSHPILSNKKDIVLINESGNITLENAVGNVNIDDRYATIKLKNIRGNIDLVTESGSVSAEKIAGNWNSRAPYTRVTLKDLSAQKVVMDNSGSNVDIELSTIPNVIDIKNQYGGVDVLMPKGFSGSVILEATYANVESDLPIRIKSLGGGAYGTGTVGSGTGKISIETESGNIRLFQR